MTGWVLDFDGEIYSGSVFGESKKLVDFSGSGITDVDPDYKDGDERGHIFKEVIKHFHLTGKYFIVLRMWHPSNIPVYHIKKLYISP